MKKRLLFIIPIASLLLSGCALLEKLQFWKKGEEESSEKEEKKTSDWDYEVEFASGTEEEKNAILRAVNYLAPCVDNKGTDFYPNKQRELGSDSDNGSGSYVKLTKTQKVGKLQVVYEWAYDDQQLSYESIGDYDDVHSVISLNYPNHGEESRVFSWRLAKATCGSAVTSSVLEYSVKLVPEKHAHENMTIAQINSVTDGERTIAGHTYPSTFDLVDYTDEDSPYFTPTPSDDPAVPADFRYVRVKGKVIYYTPDGNWLLLGDGNQVLEVYAGSALNLKPSEYPAISNGYVEVSGNLSQYQGNIQLGFVSRISPVEKGDIVDPDLEGVNITSEFIEDNFILPSSYTCQKQAINGFSNSIGKVQGTIKNGTIKDKNGDAVSASNLNSRGRFTFDLELEGGQTLTVAYDYHVDKEGDVGFFSKLQSKLVAGGKLSLKGTMRYNGNDSKPFILENNKGVWNLVPFNADDINDVVA